MTALLRVTVVIPAYNFGRYIDETLASVTAQSRPAHEVIVVDDASSDDTFARASAWQGRTGSASLTVLTGPNRGPSACRNRGMLLGTGDLFAFLDGDDCLAPWHLERLVPAFEHDSEVVVAFGDMMRFLDSGEEIGPSLALVRDPLRAISTPMAIPDLAYLTSDLRALHIRQTRILPSSWVVSREGISQGGLFDPTIRYGEDLDFFYRLLGTGRAAWYDGVTSRRREHETNASNPKRAAWSEPIILRALCQLRRFAPDLTSAEAAALDERVNETLRAAAWTSAGEGLAAFLTWRKQARRWSGERVPLFPKLWARACLAQMRARQD